MPTQNDFLVFAGGSAANVESQTTWASDAVVTNGFQSGVAQSAQVNKVLRQASIMAAMIAQFIVDHSGQPAIDNGATATLEANLLAAINAVITTFVASALGAGGTIYTPQFNAITTTGLDAGGAAVRIVYGNYGALFHSDGSSLSILLTNSGSQTGGYNSLRPLIVNLATGAVSIDYTGAGATFGGNVTAVSANISAAVTAATLNITGSASIANAALTGAPTAPTQAATDNTTKLATTAFVKQLAYAQLASFPASLNANGYQYLPLGFLMQWGALTVNTATVGTFPIAFPNTCFVILGNDAGNTASGGSTNANTISIQAISTAQFRAWGKNASGSFMTTTMAWFAVGY